MNSPRTAQRTHAAQADTVPLFSMPEAAPAAQPPERHANRGVVRRDKWREARWLGETARPASRATSAFVRHARRRLHDGEAAYGGRWARTSVRRLLVEITEELVDVAAWGALLDQRLDHTDADVSPDVAERVREAACWAASCAAEGYGAVLAALEALDQARRAGR